MNGIRERLDRGVVLGAEGYLFELERRGYVKSGPFVPEVVLDSPEAVRQLHREMLRAGAEVMVAFTYYGHRDKLRSIGREGDLEPLNRQALRLAREVAAEGDALVAGNICNTWVYDPDAPKSSGATVREMYREQVGWAAEEGADFIIFETNDYLGEALIGLEVVQELGLPALVTFASTSERTIDGYELDDACRRLEDSGADVVGLNCSRGPETMLPILERIRSAVDCHVAAQPVPYRTTPTQPTFQSLRDADGARGYPIALDPFLCTRFELADFAESARDLGVSYIGICCGGAPHHVRAMAERLGRTVPASRYSPDMTLHPVLGNHVREQAKKFVDWKD
jgi:methionine synthase I (cobalamin-dependent)